METGRQAIVSAPDEATTLQRARIICGALMGGVATFAAVASFLVASGAMSASLPESVRRYLPVAFVAAIPFLIILAPRVGEAAARGAPAGPNAFFIDMLVKQALREAVGLAGIVFGLLVGGVEWILAFAALSLVTMATGWPTAEQLRDATRQRPR